MYTLLIGNWIHFTIANKVAYIKLKTSSLQFDTFYSLQYKLIFFMCIILPLTLRIRISTILYNAFALLAWSALVCVDCVM